MSAALDFGRDRQADALLDGFESMEFEIALDLQDPILSSFEDCVRSAVSVVGGEFLFEMPADGTLEDASRIAAVRIPGPPRETILFAVLDETGSRLRVADRREMAERFHGFARAFVGVLERLRDNRAQPAVAGSA